jgi:hypothetical protein
MRPCPGPSRGIHDTSGSSQSATNAVASSGVSGLAETRSWVLMRMNATNDCQGKPTRLAPLSWLVSQPLARSWNGLAVSTA